MFPIPITFYGRLNATKLLHYKMNDNAANSTVVNSGSTGGNGVFVGNLGGTDSYTSSHNSTGRINGALNFTWAASADRDYIDGGTTAALLPTSMTAMCWFKTTSTAIGNILLAWNEYYFLTVGDKARTSYKSIELYRNDGNYVRYDIDHFNFGNILDGNWHHLVFSIEGTTDQSSILDTIFYIDGEKITGSPYASSTSGESLSFDEFTVADTKSVGNYWPFIGDIDDVRIYSGIIRPSQVSWLYNEGSGTEADLPQ